MLNPWFILAIVLAWGASMVGVGIKAKRMGHESERVEWQAREVAQVTAANAAIKRLTDEARALEARRVAGMAELARDYLQEKTANDKRAKRDADAARTGALVLRIPAAALCPGGDSTGPTRPATAGSDGAAPSEFQGEARGGILPAAITADLYAIANDADQVTRQLTACQQIVLADRKESP